MRKVMAFLIVGIVSFCYAQTGDSASIDDWINAKGGIERPQLEKSPKKFRPISKNDTLVGQYTIYYKGGGSANVMRISYVKSQKSDSGIVDGVNLRMTTVLRNTAIILGETPCDTCSRR
jgi:hypothetical protein